MRQRAADLEAIHGREELLAPQRAAHQLNRFPRQPGEVGERLVLDLAALTVGAPQQVRLVHTPLMLPPRRYYMNSPTTRCHTRNHKDHTRTAPVSVSTYKSTNAE